MYPDDEKPWHGMQLIARFSLSKRKEILSRIPKGGMVLDVGCGDMRKTHDYLYDGRRDLQIIGVEKYDDATIYGESRLPPEIAATGAFKRLQCDIENERLPFSDATFDAAYCSHVLEHVRMPGPVIREVYRVLKPGGFLYVEVPGPRSTIMPPNSWFARQTVHYPLNHWNDSTHVLPPFEKVRLREMLASAGFDVEVMGFHREFGALAIPLYALIFIAGIVPWPSRSFRSTLLGAGWWNLVGWPLFSISRKPERELLTSPLARA